MTLSYNSADASFYYYEEAAADVTEMDSSAVYGNLADAMRDSVVLLSTDTIVAPVIFPDPPDVASDIDDQNWLLEALTA